jgi:hypothetical protein
MISSPCKTCHKRHLPKKQCIDTCKKLKGVQKLQHTMSGPPLTGGGYETGQFQLSVPSSRGRSE